MAQNQITEEQEGKQRREIKNEKDNYKRRQRRIRRYGEDTINTIHKTMLNKREQNKMYEQEEQKMTHKKWLEAEYLNDEKPKKTELLENFWEKEVLTVYFKRQPRLPQ